MDIEEKIRAANIADITDNLLLTEKKVTQGLPDPPLQPPNLAGVDQPNATGLHAAHDARRAYSTPKGTLNFTEFTGKGLGTVSTGTYNNRYLLEYATAAGTPQPRS